MTPRLSAFLSDVTLLCLVTPDVGRAVKSCADTLGIGPWEVHDFVPPLQKDTKIAGEALPYTMRVAFAALGGIAWALLEPLSGPTIYANFLKRRGAGVHHAAFAHAGRSYREVIREFERRGFPMTQEGHWCTHYCYFATGRPTHLTLELIESPGAVLPKPLYRYPNGAADRSRGASAGAILDQTLSLGIVAADFDATLAAYADLGIGPWAVFESPGRALEAAVARRASTSIGSLLWEVIEPSDRPSQFREFLDRGGGGVQHVGVGSSKHNLEACREALRERGVAVAIEDGSRSCYLDTEAMIGTRLRLRAPANLERSVDPARWYPAAPAPRKPS